MELWDRAYVDLEAPAHITLDGDRLGGFQFGAVAGWIDYRLGTRDGKVSVEFSWEGRNDADPPAAVAGQPSMTIASFATVRLGGRPLARVLRLVVGCRPATVRADAQP